MTADPVAAPFTRAEFAVYESLTDEPLTTRQVHAAVAVGPHARLLAGKHIASVLASLRRKGWAHKRVDGDGDSVWTRADPDTPEPEGPATSVGATVVVGEGRDVRLLIDADAERHPLSGEHVEIVWARVPLA